MKFLKWLFNLDSRHLGDSIRYEKGKIGTRIFVIIYLLVICGATIGVEYWALNLLTTDLHETLYGIVVLILLFFPLLATSIEFCSFYSMTGFRMFVWGSLGSIIEKVENKKKKKVSLDVNNNTDEVEKTEEAPKDSKKSYKWLDLIVGILGIVLVIGVLVFAIALPTTLLN